jgi:hypothetical protein
VADGESEDAQAASAVAREVERSTTRAGFESSAGMGISAVERCGKVVQMGANVVVSGSAANIPRRGMLSPTRRPHAKEGL